MLYAQVEKDLLVVCFAFGKYDDFIFGDSYCWSSDIISGCKKKRDKICNNHQKEMKVKSVRVIEPNVSEGTALCS